MCSDRPETLYQPKPEPNRKHVYYFLTRTGTENRLEPKPEPKTDLNGTKNKHCYAFLAIVWNNGKQIAKN